MTTYALKTGFQKMVRPLARALVGMGLTPNFVTTMTLVLNVAAAAALYRFHAVPPIYPAMIVFLFFRMVLNAVDGLMAKEFNLESKIGAYLNEISDIVSDLVLFLGLIGGGHVSIPILVAFCLLIPIVEFAGVMGVAVGSGRRFDGPLGKSDRAAFLGLIAGLVFLGFSSPEVLDAVFALGIIGLVFTCWNRIAGGLSMKTKGESRMKKAWAFGLTGVIGLAIVFAAYKWNGRVEKGFEAAPAPQEDESYRAPAGAVAGDQQAILNQMSEMVLGVKTKDQVKAVANQIVKMAADPKAKNMPGVQMYGAVASLVPDFEGLFYRCREFVETSDFMHMTWLFNLRDFKYNDYLYGQHVRALFDFVTEPSEAAGPSFRSVGELQNFLLAKTAPKLEAILAQAYSLEKLPSQNFSFDFDRTLLVGRDDSLRFLDPGEAKKKFVKPYHYTAIFLLQRALGSIYYFSAMDLDELPIVYNRVIRQTTINQFTGDLRRNQPAKGVTPEMTYEIFKGTRSFLKWRRNIQVNEKKVEAQALLDRAFQFGLQSAKYQLAAYVCGLKYPLEAGRGGNVEMDLAKNCLSLDPSIREGAYFVENGNQYIFNPNSMVLGLKKKYTAFRDRVRAYVDANQGKYATILSDVTGRSVDVNVKAFFSEKVSPRDLLPTGYVNKPASRPSASVRGANAWNYDHGKPLTFADYTFGGFFNPQQVTDTGSLYQAMSTVLYSDSIAPFAIFVRVPSTVRFFIPPSEIIRR